MSDVLTTGASLQCTHQFPIPVTATRTLTIGGVSVFGGTELTAAVPSCTAGQSKCTAVTPPTGGMSTALTVDGSPVALANLVDATNSGPISIKPPPPPSPLTSA